MSTAKEETKKLVLELAQLVHDKQGEDIAVLDVSEGLVITDYFLIATARSSRQALAVARDLNAAAKSWQKVDGTAGGRITRRQVSGMENDSGWILLDLDLIIVHVFLPESRSFYDLEALWADAPRVEFTPVDNSVAGGGPQSGTQLSDNDPIWGEAPRS